MSRATNPYAAEAPDGSWHSYHGWQEGRLVRLRTPCPAPDPGALRRHASVRAMVLDDPGYTCVAARSVLRRGDYRFGDYGRLGTLHSATDLARDLWEFIAEFPVRPDRFATFLAAFDDQTVDEHDFEQKLWRQLQLLHEQDRYAAWDESVHDDPRRRGFSFSFGGRAFFVVGMHPQASRFARTTQVPLLVFNAHAQFEALRDSGQMARMQQVNRERDRRKQGSTNPNLPRFEVDSETVMYSGRHVEPSWECPLRTGGDQSEVAS